MAEWRLHHGDSMEVLGTFAEDSIDAVVCDPPYGLEFMGVAWDSFATPKGGARTPNTWGDHGSKEHPRTAQTAARVARNKNIGLYEFSLAWAEQAIRVLKPGGHLLAFGGTRTYHRMACAIEDAGFEIRDCIIWHYATGFPKSMNLGDGRGTALKPASEPICLARKPLSEPTVAANVLAHGTGALNIDASRIPTTDKLGGGMENGTSTVSEGWDRPWRTDPATIARNKVRTAEKIALAESLGRWPANVVFSCPCPNDDHLEGCPVGELDAQSGRCPSGGNGDANSRSGGIWGASTGKPAGPWYGDTGGASRFFYVAKPSRRERDHGLDDLPAASAGEATHRQDGSAGLDSPRAGAGRTGGSKNIHPTVKPVSLLVHLVRLATPPGGTVLDCFAGSGTTGVACLQSGFNFVGIEREHQYCEIARRRLLAADPLLTREVG